MDRHIHYKQTEKRQTATNHCRQLFDWQPKYLCQYYAIASQFTQIKISPSHHYGVFSTQATNMLPSGDGSDGGKRPSIGTSRRPNPSLGDCHKGLVKLRNGFDLLDIGGKNAGTLGWKAVDQGKTSRDTNTDSTTTCANNVIDGRDDTQQIFRKREHTTCASSREGSEPIPFMAPSSSKQIKRDYSDDMHCNFASPASCQATVVTTPLSAASNSPTLEVQVLYDDHRVALPVISPSNNAIDGTRNNRVDNSTFRRACIAAIKSPAHACVADRTFPILSTRNRSICNVDGGGADETTTTISSSSRTKEKRGHRVRFSPSLLKSEVEIPATNTQSSKKKPIPDSSFARKLLRKYRAEARTSSSPSQLRSLSNADRETIVSNHCGEGSVSMSNGPPANDASSSPSPPCSKYSTIARSVYAVSKLDEHAKELQVNFSKRDHINGIVKKDQPTMHNIDCYSSPLPSRRIDLSSQQSC